MDTVVRTFLAVKSVEFPSPSYHRSTMWGEFLRCGLQGVQLSPPESDDAWGSLSRTKPRCKTPLTSIDTLFLVFQAQPLIHGATERSSLTCLVLECADVEGDHMIQQTAPLAFRRPARSPHVNPGRELQAAI
ncbi:hypothetical protein CC2G_013888 [Coprinopsis cinerea AmutBmut pab1-1]|nr:hypothetical protein CC2G_013888 [Coprinopsis cinerea AmutBmut pab1-1]